MKRGSLVSEPVRQLGDFVVGLASAQHQLAPGALDDLLLDGVVAARLGVDVDHLELRHLSAPVIGKGEQHRDTRQGGIAVAPTRGVKRRRQPLFPRACRGPSERPAQRARAARPRRAR